MEDQSLASLIASRKRKGMAPSMMLPQPPLNKKKKRNMNVVQTKDLAQQPRKTKQQHINESSSRYLRDHISPTRRKQQQQQQQQQIRGGANRVPTTSTFASPFRMKDISPIPRKKKLCEGTSNTTNNNNHKENTSFSSPHQTIRNNGIHRKEYEIVFDVRKPLGFFCVTTRLNRCQIHSVCPVGQHSRDVRLQHGTTVSRVVVHHQDNTGTTTIRDLRGHEDLQHYVNQAIAAAAASSSSDEEQQQQITIVFVNQYVTKSRDRDDVYNSDWTVHGNWRGKKTQRGWDGHHPTTKRKAVVVTTTPRETAPEAGSPGDDDDDARRHDDFWTTNCSSLLARKAKDVDGRVLYQSRCRLGARSELPWEPATPLGSNKKMIRFTFEVREFSFGSRTDQFIYPNQQVPSSRDSGEIPSIEDSSEEIPIQTIAADSSAWRETPVVEAAQMMDTNEALDATTETESLHVDTLIRGSYFSPVRVKIEPGVEASNAAVMSTDVLAFNFGSPIDQFTYPEEQITSSSRDSGEIPSIEDILEETRMQTIAVDSSVWRETRVVEVAQMMDSSEALDTTNETASLNVDTLLHGASFSPVRVKIEPAVEASNAIVMSTEKYNRRYQIMVDTVESIELPSSVDVLPGAELTGCISYVDDEKGSVSPLGDLPRRSLSQKISYGSNNETLPPFHVNYNAVMAPKHSLRIKLYMFHPDQPLTYLGTAACSMLDFIKHQSTDCSSHEIALDTDGPALRYARVWISAREVDPREDSVLSRAGQAIVSSSEGNRSAPDDRTCVGTPHTVNIMLEDDYFQEVTPGSNQDLLSACDIEENTHTICDSDQVFPQEEENYTLSSYNAYPRREPPTEHARIAKIPPKLDGSGALPFLGWTSPAINMPSDVSNEDEFPIDGSSMRDRDSIGGLVEECGIAIGCYPDGQKSPMEDEPLYPPLDTACRSEMRSACRRLDIVSPRLPILSHANWLVTGLEQYLCNSMQRRGCCMRGSRCGYIHVQRSWGDSFDELWQKLDDYTLPMASEEIEKRTQLQQAVVEGEIWFTAGFSSADANFRLGTRYILYAEGGPTARVSTQGVSWYPTESAATRAVRRVLIASFWAEKEDQKYSQST